MPARYRRRVAPARPARPSPPTPPSPGGAPGYEPALRRASGDPPGARSDRCGTIGCRRRRGPRWAFSSRRRSGVGRRPRTGRPRGPGRGRVMPNHRVPRRRHGASRAGLRYVPPRRRARPPGRARRRCAVHSVARPRTLRPQPGRRAAELRHPAPRVTSACRGRPAVRRGGAARGPLRPPWSRGPATTGDAVPCVPAQRVSSVPRARADGWALPRGLPAPRSGATAPAACRSTARAHSPAARPAGSRSPRAHRGRRRTPAP